MKEEDLKLLEVAKACIMNAYSPYSGIKIAAVLLSKEGNIFSGVNVENSSYPEGVCAETSAISAMISSGDKVIQKVLILSDFREKEITRPCGGCRQRLKEFATDDVEVIITNLDQSKIETYTMKALLPHSFTLKEND